MLIVRPIEQHDFAGLKQIAIDSGHGFTSLPVDDERLTQKIASSLNSTQADFTKRGEDSYLFVLEDTVTGKIVGTTCIEASVGLTVPLYHYRVSNCIHHSEQLNIFKQLQLLSVCNDYTGTTEICTLYLNPDYRKTKSGRLLSKVRFMFMADNPERFSDTIIAEMRGVADEQGEPPFWHWLQQNFFSVDFAVADHLVGTGKKQFIAELMPKYPIYLNTLSESAQAVVGKVHKNTAPALRLLEKEGFVHRGYVDLFDAGPTVEARLNQINSVRQSHLAKVNLVDTSELPEPDNELPVYGLCNQLVEGFRATFTSQIVLTTNQTDATLKQVSLSTDAAAALNVTQDDTLRVLAL